MEIHQCGKDVQKCLCQDQQTESVQSEAIKENNKSKSPSAPRRSLQVVGNQ